MPLDPTISLKVLNPLEATAAAQQNAIRQQQIQREPLERRKLEAQTMQAEKEGRVAELEGVLKEAETAFGLLSTATDANSYQAMRQKAASMGVDISDVPEQYDPAFVRQATMLAMSAKDRIKAELDASLNQARVATETAQGRSFDALAQQRLGAMRNDAALTAEEIRRSRMPPAPTASPMPAPSASQVGGVLPPPNLGTPGQMLSPPPVDPRNPPAQPFNFGPVRDITAGIETEGQRAVAVRTAANEAQKAIDAQAEIIAAENKTRAAMQEFETAMKAQGGSPNVAQNIPIVAAAQRALDPEVATMARVQAEVAPNMRPPGSGATSDYDAKQFERATVGPEKPTEANQRIIQARVTQADLAVQKGAYLEAFRAQNGHIRGAEAAWQKYLNDNPIFDRRKQDFSLNPNRKTWQEYFGSSVSEAKPDPLGLR